MTDNCECGSPTLFTRTGRILCAHTAHKTQALGIMPADWLPLSKERPHPPTRRCLCPDCWPYFYEIEWRPT